jgi:YVTN family beta-propeller protein
VLRKIILSTIFSIILLGSLSAVSLVYAQEVIAIIPLDGRPQEMAVNPTTDKIYVIVDPSRIPSNYIVSVIDGTTETVVATIAVGGAPEGIAVNPETNKIYVVDLIDATVSVIDGVTETVVEIIAVGDEPRNIAVNP